MRIERIDAVTAMEITEHDVCCVVTLLHRGERIHTTQCAPHLLPQVIADHRKVYGDYDALLAQYPEGSYVERVFYDDEETGELIAELHTKFGVRYVKLDEGGEEK